MSRKQSEILNYPAESDQEDSSPSENTEEIQEEIEENDASELD